MDNFLWLDQTGWSAVSALASALTFVGGLIAVLIALKQVRNAQEVHIDQTRPYIIVDIEPNTAWWALHDLVIRNIGQTPAIDCRIEVSPSLQRSGDGDQHRLGDAKIFKEPIALIAPGREIRLFFDNMTTRTKTQLPMQYAVTVRYKSHATREEWTESYELDAAALLGTQNVTVYTTHHAAKALREIAQTLKKSPLAKGRLEAVTESRAEHRDRLREEFEEHKRLAQELHQSRNSSQSAS
jgi:hypothetical protein